MNTIDAYKQEIRTQPEYLADEKFPYGLPTTIPADLQRRCIFTGSGDSLAAAMLAGFFSDGRSDVMDPTDIVRNKHLADSKRLYIVSISGSTDANIAAARTCNETFAITARPDSRLAAEVGYDNVIPLEFPHTGVTTAGSISFVASAMACIALVHEPEGMMRPGRIFERARVAADKIDVSGTLYISGNILTYPLAMYMAAKFYEVLGYDARYARMEQFAHMELFSTKPGDTLLILEEPNPRRQHLLDAVEKNGTGIRTLIPAGMPGRKGRGGPVSQVLYCAFLAQLLTLKIAEERRLRECHFVTAKELRSASNAIIY